jgi:hypothetical protein
MGNRTLQILDRQGALVAELVPCAGDELVLSVGSNYRMVEEIDED